MPAETVIVEQKVTKVTVSSTGQQILVKSPIVKIVTMGILGPPGPAGPAGSVNAFEQTFSSAINWVVNHNLGRRPLVTILSTGDVEVEAHVVHTNLNQFIVYFASATAGKIRCI
jgi:hypothetical protein